MSVITLLAYLNFNRAAVEWIVVDPWAMWVGLALTLSTGLARSYRTHDLLRHPWHLLLPPVLALLMSALLWAAVVVKVGWSAAPPFQAIAALVLLTAPLAWLYAIPFDRLLIAPLAIRFRLMTLALVATWRVALLCVALSILLDDRLGTSLLLVLLVADVAMLLGMVATARPGQPKQFTPSLLAMMGGISATAERGEASRLVGGWTVAVIVVGVIALPLLAFGVAQSAASAETWRRIAASPVSEPTSVGVWILAAGAVVFFAVLLPFSQWRPRLRDNIEQLFREGRLREAIQLLSAHEPTALPLEWAPPPEMDFRDPPRLLDVLDAVVSAPAADWVRSLYMERFRMYLSDPLWYWFYDSDLDRVAGLLSRLPEGRDLARFLLKKVREDEEMWGKDVIPMPRPKAGETDKEEGEKVPIQRWFFITPDPEITPRRDEIIAAIKRLAGEDAAGAGTSLSEANGRSKSPSPLTPSSALAPPGYFATPSPVSDVVAQQRKTAPTSLH